MAHITKATGGTLVLMWHVNDICAFLYTGREIGRPAVRCQMLVPQWVSVELLLRFPAERLTSRLTDGSLRDPFVLMGLQERVLLVAKKVTNLQSLSLSQTPHNLSLCPQVRGTVVETLIGAVYGWTTGPLTSDWCTEKERWCSYVPLWVNSISDYTGAHV